MDTSRRLSRLSEIWSGVESVLFPCCCTSCGILLEKQSRYLCDDCVAQRFEDPNPVNESTCGKIILPDEVLFQDALWRYDKAGSLQRLMTMLKYEGMGEVGSELGEYLGRRLADRHLNSRISDPEEAVLLPVPLHPVRLKKRGYNQAEKIARGIQRITEVKVASTDVLLRVKHTVSQTRFRVNERLENLSKAFRLDRADVLHNRHVILVDDVFTTGSTCFSISSVIAAAKPASVSILTVGLA